MVRDIRVGPETSDPRYLTVVGNKVFFSADEGLTDAELWVISNDPAPSALRPVSWKQYP
jgi:hypothetical protein